MRSKTPSGTVACEGERALLLLVRALEEGGGGRDRGVDPVGDVVGGLKSVSPSGAEGFAPQVLFGDSV